ncbi:hypothetical protein JR315_28945 [Pseudomonas aeruginosa]|uniref:hypothetical protein n=1 Tax=Pseudomonas aeruginosa TaxID=287 RepID=UPI0022EAC4E1|nr:hypothetical protein [Pseudomonas aeruginosa]MDA3170284.1 hypothetical protein [Pseudomonas aeruginosa]
MSNELTDVRCSCGDEYPADSYDAGFIAGSGMCQNCDAALTPKDICTCPSGDGSLRHPCPAHIGPFDKLVGSPVHNESEPDLPPLDEHLAQVFETGMALSESVEQAGGDERVIGWRERILAAHPNSDPGFWPDALLVEHMAAEIADLRAALAQPSGEVVVTKNESGAIVSVTRQDKEGRVLSVIAESATLTAQAEQAEAERPEVAEVAFVLRNIGAMDAEDIDGDNVDLRFEDAEGRDTGCDVSIVEYAEKAADLFEQHDRIVGELRAVIAQLRQHKNDYMDSGQETYRALQNEIREREAEIARLDGLVSGRTAERDAALARVAELEKQERPEGPTEDELEAAGLGYPLHKEEAVKLWYSGFRSEVITVLEAWEAIGHDIGMNPDKGELLDSLRYMLEKCEAHDAALAEVAGLRSLLNSLLCYVERDIDRMRSDRDKSDNKEIYDRSISLAMERLKAAQNAVFTTEPGCDTAVELAAQTTQAQHSVPEVSGIGRDFAYPRSVVLYLRTEPTDDDLRAIHDGLLSLAAAPGKEVGHE